MDRESISSKQGIAIISLFLIGSSIILTTAGKAKKDLWIAIILSILAALPVVLIHARLNLIYPNKDLYDVLVIVFGKFIGNGISLLFIWFSFFLGGLVLRVFGDFIHTVTFPETPEIIPMLLIGALCIWATKEGIQTLGKWGELFLIAIIILLILVTLMSVNKMNINNLRPVLNEGLKPVVEGAFQSFIFPFTQTIVFTTFLSRVKGKSMYKVYGFGLLVGGMLLYISSVTDILVIGTGVAKDFYFPSYTTARRLSFIGSIEGLEIVIASTFMIGGFIKVSMCLLSSCNGIAKIFDVDNYRFIVTPIGLLILNLSFFIHGSMMEKSDFASEIYPTYALPFQVVLPIIILIAAEIKHRRLN